MAGACTKCVFFRRVRPVSQILAAAFDTATAGAEVSSALAKIVEEEQKLREAEAETKSKEGVLGRDRWPARPVTSDFCGVEEGDDVYRIAEVKNRDLSCAVFAAGQPERKPCETCLHRVPAAGLERDYRMEATYTSMIRDAIAVQASPQAPQGLLQSYRGGEAARKALEIAAAWSTKGRMMTTPEYLDHCAKYSTQDEYVVCLLQNPHHTCSGWEPVANSTEER